MRALVRESYGSPEVLKLLDQPPPSPGQGEVLVRVRAASINDWDSALLKGSSLVDRAIGGLFTPRVKVLGCDVAGVVESVGAGVTRLEPGDRVHGDLSGVGFGAFAEQVCVPEPALAPMPRGMSFDEAAALPQAGMLAVQALHAAGGVRAGQRVLLNGAGGGVGTLALQLAKLEGAHVTAVDKAAKLERLRSLGADEVIDHLAKDFTRAGEQYDLILDVRTDRSPSAYLRVLRPGGEYVTVGGDIGRLLQVVALGPVAPRIWKKRLRVVALKPNQDLGDLDGLVEGGKVVPVIDRRFPLAEAAEAFRRFAAADHFGKIILTLD